MHISTLNPFIRKHCTGHQYPCALPLSVQRCIHTHLPCLRDPSATDSDPGVERKCPRGALALVVNILGGVVFTTMCQRVLVG